MSYHNRSPGVPHEMYFNDWHRKLSEKQLMSDIDCVEYEFKNGIPKALAFVDFKNGKIPVLNRTASIEMQAAIANQLFIPFFIVLYWIESSMFFLVAANTIARHMCYDLELNPLGQWMSERMYGTFITRDIHGNPIDENVKMMSDTITRHDLPRNNL